MNDSVLMQGMRVPSTPLTRRLGADGFDNSQPVRLLVTGGTRFIGAHFADAALSSSFGVERLVVLDSLSHPETPGRLRKVSRDPRYRLVQGDTTDQDLVKRILDAHEINAVVNVAENAELPRASRSNDFDSSVPATISLLEASAAYWEGLPARKRSAFRFLNGFVSSDESIKRATENGFPFISVNSTGTYGPYQYAEEFIPRTILNALRGEPSDC